MHNINFQLFLEEKKSRIVSGLTKHTYLPQINQTIFLT